MGEPVIIADPPSNPLVVVLPTLATIAGTLACLWPVVWVLDPGGLVHGWVVLDQFTSVELGLSLCCAFFGAATAGRRMWMLLLLLVVGLLVLGLTIWLFAFFGSDAGAMIRPTPALLIACLLLMSTCLVANWRNSGADTVILIGAFLLFGYVAQYLPSWIGAPPVHLDSYLTYMVFGASGVLGQALRIISTSVVVFLLFGTAFELAGGSRTIGAVALLVARVGRGAAISVCIIASGLFGMISGSATSNVLAAGSFSIPGMKRMGVKPAAAGGIEAVASTIGQVMPPVMGAAAFLMASMTNIPYPQIALASLAPALVCYAALFLQGEALGRAIELEVGQVETGSEPVELGWSDLWTLAPVVGLIILLLLYPGAPEAAGVGAAGIAVLVAMIRKGPAGAWRDFVALWPKTVKSVTNLVITASTVGIILAVISSTGLDVQLTILISSIGEHSLLLSLLLASVTAFILGLGVGTSGVYIVTGTLLAPGLVQLGVPVIAAHLFVLYSAMLSMITPPVAFASLTAAGLAGAGFYETSNEAMRFGWALFLVPFLIVYSPELVLVGSPFGIVVVMISCVAGLLLISRFVYEGWRRASPLAWGCLAVGLVLMLPVIPLWPRLGVAIVGLGWVAASFVRRRRSARLVA